MFLPVPREESLDVPSVLAFRFLDQWRGESHVFIEVVRLSGRDSQRQSLRRTAQSFAMVVTAVFDCNFKSYGHQCVAGGLIPDVPKQVLRIRPRDKGHSEVCHFNFLWLNPGP